jgi:hypothetical protein
LNYSADIRTNNTPEEIFQTHAVKLVKPIPNQAEMCHYTSANYEDPLENEQIDWIVVTECKQE